MLISALCDYYEILKREGKLLPEAFSYQNVSYLVSITPEGEIDAVIDWRESKTIKRKGKDVQIFRSREIVLPKRRNLTSGIEAFVADHRPKYVLGADTDDSGFVYSKRAAECHKAFVELNTRFFEDLSSPVCRAYLAFVKNWTPEDAADNPVFENIKNDPKASLAFCLSGRPDILLHEDPALLAKWEKEYQEKQNTDDAVKAQCGILGEIEPIALTHNKIYGLGPKNGGSLVCVNNSSAESYGKKQGLNANISVRAMEMYTQALSYLMRDPDHHERIGGTVYVWWAMSGDDGYADIFRNMMLLGEINREKADTALNRLAEGLRSGRVMVDGEEFRRQLNPDVEFYVAGFVPGERITIRFVCHQNFGKFVENLLMHQRDFMMRPDSRQVSLFRIMTELTPPGKRKSATDDRAAAILTEKLFRSAITGTPYPEAVCASILYRIKTDRDEKDNDDKKGSRYIKMNDVRMGILKACINRKSRVKGEKEEITMSLDMTNTKPAYLCGRLFSILETTQRKASKTKLNHTIKDTYFATACTRPATTFPLLLQLAQHHLKKMDNGGSYQERKISKIMSMFDEEIPATLSLKDQAVFMQGYYQQTQYDIEQAMQYNAEKAAKETGKSSEEDVMDSAEEVG